jgi:hypothetical protein
MTWPIGADLELTGQLSRGGQGDLDLVAGEEQVFGGHVRPRREGQIAGQGRAEQGRLATTAGAARQAGGQAHQDKAAIRDHEGANSCRFRMKVKLDPYG